MKIQMFLKISVLKNFANFSGKHLLWKTRYFAGPQACIFIKNTLQHKRFPVIFLRTPFSTEQLRWLLFMKNNGNNMLKDVSTMFLTHNQSLITCNSHKNKLIWKCIHLPETCSVERFCNRFKKNSILPEIWSKD